MPPFRAGDLAPLARDAYQKLLDLVAGYLGRWIEAE